MELQKTTIEVCKIAKETASFILAQSVIIEQKDIEYKSKNDMVSYVDKEAERKICQGLQSLIPEAAFITEEKTIENKETELMWIVDPLDGTTNYIHHIPIYSISIALMKGKEILLGVVYEINQNECFHAYKDGGAYLNNRKISCKTDRDFSNALFATGFPYKRSELIDRQSQLIAHLIKNTRGVRRLGSAAVDLCYVAASRFDAFFEFDLKVWDVAAGSLIAKESNALVSDFSGDNNYLFGKEIIAAQRRIYTQSQQEIQKFMQHG